MNVLLRPIAFLGQAALDLLGFIGGIGYLLTDTFLAAERALLFGRGRRMGWRSLWTQMVRVGVNSIPIVMLVLYCIGAILALQMEPTLRQYGATDRVADIISVAIFRELGPLVAAIVLTGFAGASIAAEVGSMVVSEEVEALEAQAINPIRFLVVPRVMATTVMTVCLTIVADLTGVLGGMTVAHLFMGISVTQYRVHTFESIQVRDFTTGLIKAGVFGTMISALACYLGLNVTGGATGVGVATTRTVVLTIVALILIDLIFTSAFYALGW